MHALSEECYKEVVLPLQFIYSNNCYFWLFSWVLLHPPLLKWWLILKKKKKTLLVFSGGLSHFFFRSTLQHPGSCRVQSPIWVLPPGPGQPEASTWCFAQEVPFLVSWLSDNPKANAASWSNYLFYCIVFQIFPWIGEGKQFSLLSQHPSALYTL